mmetsp:Transcript_67278/g.161270  ORF Transcript_67278/g.161270 Transcript_67278/m.161270 type:complete len:530 (+) Transcript_67278:86-1675(+)
MSSFHAGAAMNERSSVNVLLKVTVEVSEDRSETIIVCEGDDPHELAERFCICHGLDAGQFVEPLELHIRENLERAVNGPGLPHEQLQKPRSQATSPRPRSQQASEHAEGPELLSRSTRGSHEALGRMARTPSSTATATPQSVRGLGGAARAGVMRGAEGRPLSARGGAGSSSKSRPQELSNSKLSAAFSGSTLGTSRAVSSTDIPSSNSASAPSFHPAGSRTPQPAPQSSSSRGALRRQGRENGHAALEDTVGSRGGTGDLQNSRLSYASSSGTTPRRLRTHPGERLYRDAALRQEKLEALRAQQAARRREEETEGVTFAPEITASQRTCQGISKSMLDPEGSNTKLKIELKRQQQANVELEGCSFKPQIDAHSEEIVHSRLSRLKITGALHDQLYEDARRRQERASQYAHLLPREVTFQPDIGANHFRPPNDDTQEDFVNRLAYSKSYSEQWLAIRQQQQEQDVEQWQRDLRVHSEPALQQQRLGKSFDSMQSPRERVFIGDYFYELMREKGLNVQPRSARGRRSTGG